MIKNQKKDVYMSKLFDKKIPHACSYCIYSAPLSFGTEVMCRLRGITSKDDSCRRYKYDPLKRTPQKVSINTDFNENDFKI